VSTSVVAAGRSSIVQNPTVAVATAALESSALLTAVAELVEDDELRGPRAP
jgi:hypothetical protein